MIFVYIFAGLIVLLLLVAAGMPRTFSIEKSIIIKKPIPDVRSWIGDLERYAAWNPWQQMEPGSGKTFTGAPFQVGHQYKWEGKKIGVGSLTLVHIDDRHINFNLQFLKPWKSTAKDNWVLEPWGDIDTKVIWQNSGELPWPIARLMGPLIQKNLDKQFEKGLENLKKACEGN